MLSTEPRARSIGTALSCSSRSNNGTSPAGREFIAHSKSYTDVDGDSWMGSWNFSESASSQVNHAFAFTNTEWRDAMIAQFNTDVAFAWANEASYQLMSVQPTPASA